jgi:hypothetical protein
MPTVIPYNPLAAMAGIAAQTGLAQGYAQRQQQGFQQAMQIQNFNAAQQRAAEENQRWLDEQQTRKDTLEQARQDRQAALADQQSRLDQQQRAADQRQHAAFDQQTKITQANQDAALDRVNVREGAIDTRQQNRLTSQQQQHAQAAQDIEDMYDNGAIDDATYSRAKLNLTAGRNIMGAGAATDNPLIRQQRTWYQSRDYIQTLDSNRKAALNAAHQQAAQEESRAHADYLRELAKWKDFAPKAGSKDEADLLAAKQRADEASQRKQAASQEIQNFQPTFLQPPPGYQPLAPAAGAASPVQQQPTQQPVAGAAVNAPGVVAFRKIGTQQEYDSLPSGSDYIDATDGQHYRKP